MKFLCSGVGKVNLFKNHTELEAGEEILKRVRKIKQIEIKYDSEIIFENKLMNGGELIKKIRDYNGIGVGVGVGGIYIKETQIPYGIMKLDPQRTDNGNNIEKKIIKHIDEKDEDVRILCTFIKEFNLLAEDAREIIYYCFIQSVNDVEIYNEIIMISKRTYYRKKRTAKIEFANNLFNASVIGAFLIG